MRQQYFIAVLFATALYWMYLLYTPFLFSLTIAVLLAVSTANVQYYFEQKLNSKLFAALSSTFLLALLFFAPLGYFLTTLTMQLNSLEPEVFKNIVIFLKKNIQNPPEYLVFIKPYIKDIITEIDIKSISAHVLSVTGKIGALSAVFVKNALFVIIFYFFAQYNSSNIIDFFKRIIQISVEESTMLIKELSSVMSVVFYSILATAMFEGALFGIVISYMGYNGLLFGIMYGFASLIPVVGGVLMWLPFMLYQFYIGDTSGAIFIAVYTIVVISIIADTFIKPLIIKAINQNLLKDDDTKLDELVIFFAIIAGLSTFGFWGMILGPAITAFFLTILKLFEKRNRECRIESHEKI